VSARFQAGPEPAFAFVELADQFEQTEGCGMDMRRKFGDFGLNVVQWSFNLIN